MASPQLENGFTKIADEILEALARIRIPGQAMQVLFVVIRKTYGFNKKQDKIAHSQFHKFTGLPSNKICNAINKLEQMNLIFITQKGNRDGATYQFNKIFHTWKPLPKKVTITQKGNELLPKKGGTKETIQKRINSAPKKTGAKANPNVKKFINWWFDTFQEKTGKKYIVSGGKEGKIVKDLLISYSFDELVVAGKLFFNSTDQFILNAGYTIGVFKSQINKIGYDKVTIYERDEEAMREALS